MHIQSADLLFARPNEGSLRFNVEFSPMASPNFEPGRPTETANELARLIERGLRETKAVDVEALCVLAGRKVCPQEVLLHFIVLSIALKSNNTCSLCASVLFVQPAVFLTGGTNTMDCSVHGGHNFCCFQVNSNMICDKTRLANMPNRCMMSIVLGCSDNAAMRHATYSCAMHT